jgi:hypothetical protein
MTLKLQRSCLFQQDKEIHILLEDQQKINKFARLNSRLDELKVINQLFNGLSETFAIG